MKIRDEIFEQFNIVRERIAQGIHDNDWSAVGWNVALIAAVIMVAVALAVGVLALVWKILGTLLGKIFSVPLLLLILGLAAKGQQRKPEPEALCKPTAEDYEAVNKTLKPALVKLAPALGLAPIHRYDDIRLDPEDRITQHRTIWRMGFGALKKTVGVDLNENQCKRAIQAEVKRVLERENPAGFSEVRFPYGGTSEPIIQIDEILQDDAYIYILAVIASNAYFRQKRDRNNQDEVRPTPQDPMFM